MPASSLEYNASTVTWSNKSAAGDSAVDQEFANFDTTAAHCPATLQRPQAINADAFIDKPGIARATLAVSEFKPDGSANYSRGFRDHTVLQQHILFWDRDGDGAIYPWDTYTGFRELGFSIVFSLLAAFIINVNFSYPTRLAYSYIPDPWFRVYVGGIHKAKHGSDSGVYDTEGRFVPQKFEDIFSKWDKNDNGALSFMELWTMIAGNRLAVDPFGVSTTWLLLQKNGKVSKEDLRQTYDGSIFWSIREQRLRGRVWDRGFGPRDLVRLGVSEFMFKSA